MTTDSEMTAKEMRDFIERVEHVDEHRADLFRTLCQTDQTIAREALEQRKIAREAQEWAESVISSCDFIYNDETGENEPKAPREAPA